MLNVFVSAFLLCLYLYKYTQMKIYKDVYSATWVYVISMLRVLCVFFLRRVFRASTFGRPKIAAVAAQTVLGMCAAAHFFGRPVFRGKNFCNLELCACLNAACLCSSAWPDCERQWLQSKSPLTHRGNLYIYLLSPHICLCERCCAKASGAF